MSPRRADPDVAVRLLEVTARLLADEGLPAVSARRVAAEAGASTMAVYTHYGSMDDLLRAARREGFRRFALELDRRTHTDDPVADLFAQGWGYRHFALTEPHLYKVMFDTQLVVDRVEIGPEDVEAGAKAFSLLYDDVGRCAAQRRWQVADQQLASEVIWAGVHGHCMLELSGYFVWADRDPRLSYAECLLRGSIAFGDDPRAAAASSAAARRRARRAGQLDDPAATRTSA
jgi:AcrR family transcriptional regulator